MYFLLNLYTTNPIYFIYLMYEPNNLQRKSDLYLLYAWLMISTVDN